jgi:hypothetical protein
MIYGSDEFEDRWVEGVIWWKRELEFEFAALTVRPLHNTIFNNYIPAKGRR